MGDGLRRAFAAAKATRIVPVWCVKHRNGWCATATGKSYTPDAVNVRTLCKHSVCLPGGAAIRIPTCVECIEAIQE
jgi:hypothetical protein